MEIKDIQANQGKIDIVATVTEKGDVRTFNKFGKEGRVCNAKIKDETGEITLTLWNDDIDTVNVGDKVHVQNGWCSEYRDQKQLSAGKFGKIEVVGSAEPQAQGEVVTNDPGMLQQAADPSQLMGNPEEVADSEPMQEELQEDEDLDIAEEYIG